MTAVFFYWIEIVIVLILFQKFSNGIKIQIHSIGKFYLLVVFIGFPRHNGGGIIILHIFHDAWGKRGFWDFRILFALNFGYGSSFVKIEFNAVGQRYFIHLAISEVQHIYFPFGRFYRNISKMFRYKILDFLWQFFQVHFRSRLFFFWCATFPVRILYLLKTFML